MKFKKQISEKKKKKENQIEMTKYKKNKNRLLKALFCANYQYNYPH